jgi:prevent-host-death family protein
MTFREHIDNLVRMTRKMPIPDSAKSGRGGKASQSLPGHWLLQDAKARFSELVRKVRSEGPQHVSVHGRDAVVVISSEEFRRLRGQRTGADLIAVMQACPHPEIELTEAGAPMPVRPVEL